MGKYSRKYVKHTGMFLRTEFSFKHNWENFVDYGSTVCFTTSYSC